MTSDNKTSAASISKPVLGKNFLLEYVVESAIALGVDSREISSRLVIRSDSRQAFLEKHRSESDSAGEAIGTFQSEVSDKVLTNILAKANRTIVPALPPARGGGPGSTVITLRFEEGERKIMRTFTTGDMNILSVVEELLSALAQLSGQLEAHPLCALQTAIEYKDSPQPHFVLTLRNIGRQRICFADPRLLPPGDPDCWAGAQVAELPEEKPGITSPPLQWTRLSLETPAPSALAANVVLGPGESLSAKTVIWKNWRPKTRYLALGIYSDYTGPAEINGIYRIRGATFSNGLEFTLK